MYVCDRPERPDPGLHQDWRAEARHSRSCPARARRLGIGGAPGLGTAGLGVGPRLLQRRFADLHVGGRRRERADSHYGPHLGFDTVTSFGSPDTRPPSSRTCTPSARTRRATCIRARPSTAAAFRSSRIECNNGNGGNGYGKEALKTPAGTPRSGRLWPIISKCGDARSSRKAVD